MLLAQTAPDAWIAWNVVLTVLMFSSVTFAFLNYRRNGSPQRRELQQPLEIKESPLFVTKPYCDANHRATNERVERVESEVAELRAERRTDAAALHEKINDVAKSVSALESGSNIQNSRLATIETDIKTLLRRA